MLFCFALVISTIHPPTHPLLLTTARPPPAGIHPHLLGKPPHSHLLYTPILPPTYPPTLLKTARPPPVGIHPRPLGGAPHSHLGLGPYRPPWVEPPPQNREECQSLRRPPRLFSIGGWVGGLRGLSVLSSHPPQIKRNVSHGEDNHAWFLRGWVGGWVGGWMGDHEEETKAV